MRINVKVMPHSAREEVFKRGEEYVVRVRQAPEDGKANEAMLKLMAAHLKVPRASIKIVSGLTSRHKILDIRVG